MAEIPLGGRRFVYDVRSERARGVLDRLVVPLTPRCARVFRLGPGPAPDPVVKVPDEVMREQVPARAGDDDAVIGGLIPCTVGLARPAAARELVRLTVTDAQGRRRPELRQTVWITGAPVRLTIPLALNDPVGEWTVKAAVVGTDRNAQARVRVADGAGKRP